jgi:virulence factor Mce-like protein
MRRGLVAAALVMLAIAGAAAVVTLPSSGSTSAYEVDVVFDDSRGLLVGQLVQIAGARVGSIVEVTVTDDYKARVHMTVDRRFAPFREDATCTIKPSGLIAENYVQCDPGTPDAPPLRGRGDEAPTVPVENTTQPVSLTDLFEVWNTPTRQRLGVMFSTLGIATAGRGEDLNDVLRRANPSLALARKAVGLLERQRSDLAAIVDQTGRVAQELARRPERLEDLVRHTGRVATRVASHRGSLDEGLRRLPGLLEQARPALAKLDALSEAGVPLVRDLEQAAPAINDVSAGVPRLARAARPALSKLAPVLRDGARTARNAAPLTALVARYTTSSLPTTETGTEMLTTLEERGFVRSIAEFFHNGALAAARFDDQGHIIPAHVTFTECGVYATTPTPGCGLSATNPARRRAVERRPGRAPERRPDPRPAAPEIPRPEIPRPRVPELPEPDVEVPRLPDVGVDPQLEDTLDSLLDYLLG